MSPGAGNPKGIADMAGKFSFPNVALEGLDPAPWIREHIIGRLDALTPGVRKGTTSLAFFSLLTAVEAILSDLDGVNRGQSVALAGMVLVSGRVPPIT